MPELPSLAAQKHTTLLEVLEHVLDKGVVLVGDVTISVAGVDLIYLGLRLLLTSVEAFEQARPGSFESSTAAYPNLD